VRVAELAAVALIEDEDHARVLQALHASSRSRTLLMALFSFWMVVTILVGLACWGP
jgi:hypothetical protein